LAQNSSVKKEGERSRLRMPLREGQREKKGRINRRPRRPRKREGKNEGGRSGLYCRIYYSTEEEKAGKRLQADGE